MTLLNRRNLVKSESGVAMPAVILVVALLAIMAIGSVRTVGDEVKASTQMSESAKAFYAAEAGVDLIMATWDSLEYDTLMPNPGDTAMLDWTSLPENGTAFRALLQRVDDGSGPAFSVRVQGRGGVGAAGTRSISAVVESGGGAFLPFEWALFGHKDLTIENNGTLDGSVGANGFIDFVGGATVTGDAQAGDSIVGNTSGVAGSVTENAPWSDSLPRIPCPPAPFGPVPGGGANVSFNASNGNITISGAATPFSRPGSITSTISPRRVTAVC